MDYFLTTIILAPGEARPCWRCAWSSLLAHAWHHGHVTLLIYFHYLGVCLLVAVGVYLGWSVPVGAVCPGCEPGMCGEGASKMNAFFDEDVCWNLHLNRGRKTHGKRKNFRLWFSDRRKSQIFLYLLLGMLLFPMM